MSVRVRFAPSPTGNLHIGGARTALYCHLIAKATGGKFILRIEDTDLERSTKESELSILEDLKWCGLEWHEGPEKGGDFGPYRQSERLDIYKSYADQLVEQGMAYPCFLTSQELETLTEEAKAKELAPHAYHGKYRDLPKEEAQAKIDAGEEYVIRFKNPQKTVTFKDLVRGEVTFHPDMVGDFVIMRSNGMPVYNFCCVIDDWKMEMTHVIRAEEHLNNSLRQLLIYEALEAPIPEFAHCSLLVGEDRQKLSKRHGHTSVKQYRDMGYLPEALMNYLCLLGWSHPDETDIFTLDEAAKVFDLTRFSKSPALYDVQKLNYFNGQHLRKLSGEKLLEGVQEVINKHSEFWKMDQNWQERVLLAFAEKVQLFSEFPEHIKILSTLEKESGEEIDEVNGWETTATIRDYLRGECEKIQSAGGEFATEENFADWTNHVKKELKIKGKQLFKGMRAALTLHAQGPDLKVIIPMTPIEILLKRLSA